jgi:hypothetical protein
MPLKIMRETTQWRQPGPQPNHVYLMSGDRALAYVPWGHGAPVYFRTFLRLDRRGRRFVEEKHNAWGFDLSIEAKSPEIAQSLGQTWQVPGSQGKVYTVNLLDGQWSCSCPGHMFRRQCRHVAELQQKEQTAPL